jgi:hypothetical protein
MLKLALHLSCCGRNRVQVLKSKERDVFGAVSYKISRLLETTIGCFLVSGFCRNMRVTLLPEVESEERPEPLSLPLPALRS